MSGILRLESLTKGNTLKQGDKTPLKYRLFDADGEKLNIAGKTAKVRLVYPDFLTIGYEKDGLTVAQDDTVTFTIDTIIPSRIYHVEIIVDDKFIFPSRADESKFTVDKSSLGTESNIVEIVGVDAVVRKAVDLINEDPSLIIDEDKLVTDIISNTGIGNINEYYKAFNDLKPKAEQSITKSAEALTKSQNALNVANGIDAKATNALSLSESADTLSKSVQEQFNQVIIDGDSSVEAAQARVDASGQTNPTLKARLDKEHNEVTTQLAQKVGGNTKAKLEDLSAEVLGAMSGEAEFNLLSIPQNKSVTPSKTTFANHGKNLVDSDSFITNTSLNFNTGQPMTVAGAMLSDIHPIEPNADYVQNKSAVICFYDSGNNFIVGSGLQQVLPYSERTFKTPANATGYRTAIVNSAYLSSYQIEKGTTATAYEPYKILIDRLSVSNRSLSQLNLKAPFVYLLAGQQIILDWSTKKVTGNTLTFYYDNTGISTPAFNLDVPLNAVSWLYIDLYNNTVQISQKGSVSGDVLVILEIYATTSNLSYYTPHRPAVKLLNYNSVTPQYLNGREVIDKSIEENKLSDSVQVKLNSIPKNGYERLFTFNDALVSWQNGGKFPIAFFSDSTTDGVGTTGWVGNVIGQDSKNENAYPKLLENKLRNALNSSNLRIYNAGFSGKTADWARVNFDAEFTGASAFSDVKMIGIGFGINDRLLYTTTKEYREGFKDDVETIIHKCFDNNIQPFLMTTQMAVSPGADTAYPQFPLRDALSINTIANEVKRELSKEYNLELIDINHMTEHFVHRSSHSILSIIPDKLHFGNVGHEYMAQLLFAVINPQTEWIKKPKQLDYAGQKIIAGVPEDLVTIPANPTDSFKALVNYTKSDSLDKLIFKMSIFIHRDSKLSLKAYKSDAQSITYVKVNGVDTALDSLEKTISDLDLGLHTLEVYSGASTRVDFKGFKLE